MYKNFDNHEMFSTDISDTCVVVLCKNCGGGTRILQTGGREGLTKRQKPIIWQDFCQKLHKNERN